MVHPSELLKKAIRTTTKKIETKKKEAQNRERLLLPFQNRELEQLLCAINELYEAEEEKQHRQEQKLKKVQAEISAISHDLRTPLTAVQGYVELLEKSQLSKFVFFWHFQKNSDDGGNVNEGNKKSDRTVFFGTSIF